MAHDDKTEKPTAKRKREARKKGQVAKSTDLNAALVLMGGLIAVTFMGPKVVSGVANAMRSAFRSPSPTASPAPPASTGCFTRRCTHC
jgi:flagellar biosynthesis protein FlhB